MHLIWSFRKPGHECLRWEGPYLVFAACRTSLDLPRDHGNTLSQLIGAAAVAFISRSHRGGLIVWVQLGWVTVTASAAERAPRPDRVGLGVRVRIVPGALTREHVFFVEH
jgi:hypothetical protein